MVNIVSIEFYYIAVCILLGFAVFDLMVGVTNDAVNFLNSSIGSKAAPFKIIMIVASLGILAGVTFSGGMMEVARKGIFHPQFFTMPNLITIFLAVMLTDILLLDLFNTHGLPTSTTVSIVFELLGAAVAVSLIKIMTAVNSNMAIWEYINTAKALTIISGILLSIVVAFFSGALVQFISRLIFTFDYKPRMKRYGALWGGVAMSAITFFILIKGSKGATFMTPEMVTWIKTHAMLIMFLIFAVSAVILQIMLTVFNANILKPIILIGTFALAMAFAANDLVNFIGVPLAGLNAYKTAIASSDPLGITMAALSKKVQSHTFLMLLAGAIMVITLWMSKKARTVTETEISLGQQDEGAERFESVWLSRRIVNMVDSVFSSAKLIFPEPVRAAVARRLEPVKSSNQKDKPSFDMIRASVNLMVASAVVSLATSMKLPLSTTYVTFMVAMGTSFSDQAWGRESAVYRVTGVLTVIGGWFMTAFIAFMVSFCFAMILFYFPVLGVIGLFIIAGFLIWKNHHKHRDREQEKDRMSIFTLKEVDNFDQAVSDTFEHLGHLVKEIRVSMNITFDALFNEDLVQLRQQRKQVKQIQKWTNTIISNIFRVLRLLRKEDKQASYNYYQIIRRLQKLSDGHRDTVIRSTMHVANRHTRLKTQQAEELNQLKSRISDVLLRVEKSFLNKEISQYQNISDQFQDMKKLVAQFNETQMHRIIDGSSKTRKSVLYYAISGNCLMMVKQNIKLLEILNDAFTLDGSLKQSYLTLDSH